MKNLQRDLVGWHLARFPEADLVNVALKLCEEAGEVAKAVNALAGGRSATGGGSVPDEVADVIICSLIIMERWFPDEDIEVIINKKLFTLLDLNSGHPASLRYADG